MLKPRILRLIGLFALASSALADTVILNNGEKVEGKILRESDTEVVLEVRTASIVDERVFKRSEVKEVQKLQPDVMAWAELKGIGLGDESRDSADYAAWIERLKNFVTAFPKSANVATANTQIKALEDEKKRVDAGEIKLDGKWLSKEELEQEHVQIEGKLLLRRMQKLGAAGDLIEVLNTFDVIEKRASASASFPDAILIARQANNLLRPRVEKRKQDLKDEALENKRRVDNLRGVDKSTLESAHKLTAKRVEEAVATYEQRGAKWMPLTPATERSLTNLGNKLLTENAALNRYIVEKMKEGLAGIEKTKALLKEEKYAEAEDLYRKASQLWPQNEYSKRLQPVIAEAKVKAAAAKVAADKAAIEAKLQGGNPLPKTGVPGTTVAAAKKPEGGAPAVEDEVKKEPSIFSKPTFWVISLIVLGLAFAGMKGIKKAKNPGGNLMDM